jgi:uncharacterized protein YbjQ (UPF0145 family)
MNWVVSCTLCGSSYVYGSGQGLPDMCPVCSEKGKREVKKFLEKEQKRKEILTVSTAEVPNRKIVKTLGIVFHEHLFGIGLVKEMDINAFNGGVSLDWAEKVRSGRELVIRSIEDEAIEMGGNGVISADVTYKTLGTQNDLVMMFVSGKGTAVILD